MQGQIRGGGGGLYGGQPPLFWGLSNLMKVGKFGKIKGV